MSIFSPEPDPRAYGTGKQYFLVNSDQLEELIVQLSPDIRRDTNRMEDLIREMVDTDRAKAGLGATGGKGTLQLNPKRRNPKAPDFTGRMRISGKSFEVNAYVGHNQEFINLTFTAA